MSNTIEHSEELSDTLEYPEELGSMGSNLLADVMEEYMTLRCNRGEEALDRMMALERETCRSLLREPALVVVSPFGALVILRCLLTVGLVGRFNALSC